MRDCVVRTFVGGQTPSDQGLADASSDRGHTNRCLALGLAEGGPVQLATGGYYSLDGRSRAPEKG